jgi:hypothetical protein
MARDAIASVARSTPTVGLPPGWNALTCWIAQAAVADCRVVPTSVAECLKGGLDV